MCYLGPGLRFSASSNSGGWLGLQFHLRFGVLLQDHSSFFFPQNFLEVIVSVALVVVGVHSQFLEVALKT